jgi:hypothetical protein
MHLKSSESCKRPVFPSGIRDEIKAELPHMKT